MQTIIQYYWPGLKKAWYIGCMLMAISQLLGCASINLTSLVMPENQQDKKTAEHQETTTPEALPLKRLDFEKITTRYVEARLKHPQLLALLEHAEWRPHPLSDAWLDHPFRERPVSRFILKVTPTSNLEEEVTPENKQKQEKPDKSINSVEHIHDLTEVLLQGGYASLSQVIYLIPEINSSKERATLIDDLKLISVLKSDIGKHARVLYLANADSVNIEYLEETQNIIQSQHIWKTFSRRSLHNAMLVAWINALAKHQPDELLQALKPAGDYLNETSLPEEIRGEIYLVLAKYLPPVMIPGLQESLLSPGENGVTSASSRVIKHYTMQANLIYALNHTAGGDNINDQIRVNEPYPQAIWQVEWAEEADLRRMYAYWLTLIKPEQGLEILQRQLMDHNSTVRDAVLLSLGYWPDSKAKELLRKYSQNPAENIRLACVSGLAGHGSQALRLLSQDEAYRVRAQVAQALGYSPSLEAAVIIQDLLVDQNPQVEQAAMNQIVNWSDEFAIPLCIHSAIYSSRATRLSATYQLQQRTGMVITQLEGTATERRGHILSLAANFGIKTDLWGQLMNPQQQPNSSEEQFKHRQELETWFNQLKQPTDDSTDNQNIPAIELLRSDIPIVENLLKSHTDPAVKAKVIKELCVVFPEFQAIEQLRMQDVEQRRKAARMLAEHAQQASLTPLLLEEVASVIEREQDEQVWKSIARAITDDASDTHLRIVRMMLKHRWVDLQKLGCDYAAEHQLGTLAPDILVLFQSRDHALIQKAVHTAGRLGNPMVIDHPQGGIRSLINHPLPGIRKEATIALARLHDPQGIADLVRLAHSSDHQVRFEAIELIGELNDPKLIKQLHQLLWLEQNQLVKMCIITSLERLTPTEEWPYKQEKSVSDQDRAKLWIEYLNAR